MTEIAAVFSALSDETRLRILALLANGELCVCQIESVLRMQQSKISRHLTVLRQAGLVSGRREGVWIHYSLPESKDDFHLRVVDCLKTCLQANPQVQADIRRIAECPPIGAKCCTETGKDRSHPPPRTKLASRRSRGETPPSPRAAAEAHLRGFQNAPS